MIDRWVQRLTAFDGATAYVRGLLVSLTAGLFLAIAGAFGSGDAPFFWRLTYWIVMTGGGFLWGALISRLFFAHGKRRTGNVWLDIVVASIVMAVPFTAVVGLGTRFFLGAPYHLRNLPLLFGPVLVVSLAITSIITLLETRSRAITHAAPTPPKFLERLPLKLRGAEVWAVEAEDHYLRLHTSKGQDLILMRLADAVAELEGIEGAQVHRSWWVARDAITDARRGDGRATLTLKDSSEVPVSRTYAGLLRERGWI